MIELLNYMTKDIDESKQGK